MRFSRELYPKIALLKSAYSFTDKAYVHLDADDDYYYVEMKPKADYPAVNEDDFVNEMLCQCVRHEVYLQTKNLRELLVARAMASTVISEPDDAKLDLDSSQDAIKDDLAKDAKIASSILKDWFDADA